MNHLTDVREAGADASMLTDVGSGGLIGRAVLSEAPLAAHLADDEAPRARAADLGVELLEPSDLADRVPHSRSTPGEF